jgi:hypothetical protein|tara:strand:+ start:1562 stop:1729 length:168 start_codon:yes stop_codon:yes gene_type:complete
MSTFDEVRTKVTEELRGNLTVEEYKELISLEYVLTWGYDNPEDEERYKELRIKKK